MRFIVANSHREASASADVDWSWQRIGKNKWRDKYGFEVSYCADQHELRGHRGAVIYLGWAWWENPNWRDGRLREIAAHQGHQLCEVG